MPEITPPKPKSNEFDEIGKIIVILEGKRKKHRGDKRKLLNDIIVKLINFKNEI